MNECPGCAATGDSCESARFNDQLLLNTLRFIQGSKYLVKFEREAIEQAITLIRTHALPECHPESIN